MSNDTPPSCEICDAPVVFYQRVRFQDLGTDRCKHPVFDSIPSTKEDSKALTDVIIHSCGSVILSQGRKQFGQSTKCHDFKHYDMQPWKEHNACPEATRILKDLREQSRVRVDNAKLKRQESEARQAFNEDLM